MRKPNWQDEGGQVFGEGSQATIVVAFLVKKPGDGACEIKYFQVADRMTRDEKLTALERASIGTTPWTVIRTNNAGDWLEQRTERFEGLRPVGTKGARTTTTTDPIFVTFSSGLDSGRDAWVYNSEKATVGRNIGTLVATFNNELAALTRRFDPDAISRLSNGELGRLVDVDPKKIAWGAKLWDRVRRGTPMPTADGHIVEALYRPFFRQHAYFSSSLNHSLSRLPQIYPPGGTGTLPNVGFYCVGAGSAVPFSVQMTDRIPDRHLTGAGSGGQYFPRWSYAPDTGEGDPQDLFSLPDPSEVVIDGYRRRDNIGADTLADYRKAYGADTTADDVFYYIYGLLHSGDYRAEFAADLKKMLPRIPKVSGRDNFCAFVSAGHQLAEMHVGYDRVEPYPLLVTGGQPTGPGSADLYEWFRVEKMRWGGTGRSSDRSTIHYNSRITVSGIPDEAHEYLLGSRSGLEWVMERYQVTTNKASGIVNDPNHWSREQGDPRYILDLLARVVTVSVETVKIVRGLPRLDLEGLS